MSLLATWRSKHPGQPDPDEKTLRQWIVDSATMIMWREENPNQPDPDNETFYTWLCELERKYIIKYWRNDHPGQPLPDTYEEVRRWVINQDNIDRAMFVRSMEETQGKKPN